MSLATCLNKAGNLLPASDKMDILERANAYAEEGLSPSAAAARAVADQLAQVQAELDAATQQDQDGRAVRLSPAREELREWAGLVMGGRNASPKTIVLANTLPHLSMAMAGLKSNSPVTIDAGAVYHMAKRGHAEVDANVIADLPILLAKPRATITNIDPVTGRKQWQILADHRDDQGRPFLIALRPFTANAGRSEIQVTGVINAFGKDNSMRYILDQLLKGNVAWMPKKEVARIQQFLNGDAPLTNKAGSSEGQSRTTNIIVPSEDSLVKYRNGDANWATSGETIAIPKDIMSRVGDAKFSPSRPQFYSQLQRAVEGVPDRLATMAAPQWKLWLDANAGKLGVKKDEIEFSGVKDYLDMRGKDKVTREEIAGYLDENGVKVQEVVLGGGAALSFEAWVASKGYDSDAIAEFGGTLRRSYEAFKQGEGGRESPTKYASYTVPGGENYREILITLPEKPSDFYPQQTELAVIRSELANPNIPPVIEARLRVRQAQAQAKLDSLQKPVTAYKSSHFDERNILAHLRVDDRVDADGKRVLFINEVQSDFGQGFKKSKMAISQAVDEDFEGIVKRMKAAGVLEVVCD